VCWDDRDIINGKPTGAIRVSVPYFACDSDIDKFVEFIDLYFVEHAPGESSNAAARSKSHTAATLEKIIVYPIKSCGGFEVQEWPISDEGLVYDREWTLVDSENQYINQRRVRISCNPPGLLVD
jgi:molybdenum cofactor sulfurtransferase